LAFEELKRRSSEAWGSAPFENVEADIAVVHDGLVARLEPRHGLRWLDVGCGPGAVALRAARAGAEVTGLDLAPGLLETARRRAAEEGLAIQFDIGDVEALPYPDASFDVVSSSFGAIFALDHRAAASELARVARPGGRLGLSAWRPDAGVCAVFEIYSDYQPPPPEGVGTPFQWGSEEYASSLLGDAFALEFVDGDAPLVKESPEAAWTELRENVGPPKALYESLDPERREELGRRVVEYYERFRQDGGIHQPRPYLLVLGTRR
jgi:SAM-dependent methyltransferase